MAKIVPPTPSPTSPGRAPDRTTRTTRTSRLGIVVIVLVILGVTGFVLLRPSGKPSSKPSDKPSTAPPVQDGNGAVAPTVYSPQTERRFHTIGSTGEQFTGAQFDALAKNYGIVILNKGYSSIVADYEAVRELKKRNPSIKVYAYFNTKIWFDSNETKWVEPGYNPIASFKKAEWLLKDAKGAVVAQRKNQADRETAQYLDVSNPEYRAWALGVLEHWMSAAPFDGIHFDSGNDLADGFDGRNWSTLLPPGKMGAVNAGIKDLQTAAKQHFADKPVTFNGIAPARYKGPDRSLSMLTYLDGATDEDFCLSPTGGYSPVLNDDIGIMQAYPKKMILLHSSYPAGASPAVAAPAGRYCLGNFLMGWQPGASYFKFAIGAYGVDTLAYDLPELNLNLGTPTDAYKRTGSLLSRTFTYGIVYVNQGNGAQTITLGANVTRYEDGAAKEALGPGATYVLGPQSAAYFMYRAGG